MIVAIAPSPLRFAKGTTMYGSKGNSLLPDYLLGNYRDAKKILNKFIGDDFVLPDNNFYKIFSINSGILHEYTMYRHASSKTEAIYIPISIKRYPVISNSCTYTYLYLKGVTVLLHILKGMIDYELMSLHQLVQLAKIYDNNAPCGVPYDPVSISLDCPDYIQNILEYLGQSGLLDSSSATEVLKYYLAEHPKDMTLINRMPDDYISAYGCSDYPFIEESKLLNMRDISQYRVYTELAQDQIARSANIELLPLDLSTEYFYEFEIDRIIEEIYCMPFTDMYVELNGLGQVQKSYYSLLAHQDESNGTGVMIFTPNILHDAIVKHNKTHVVSIANVSLCKTWLDELYLTIVYTDGGHQCYYLNLSAYHMYTPSLIRLHSIC